MPLRLALIGYGRIAPKHLEVFRELGAEIVACCNRSEANRRKATEEGKIPKTYDSVDTMLREERPDGVISCASFFEVAHTARQVIPTGTPVLLEKPPGTSLTEYRELLALAEKHRTPVMVGVNRRFYGVLRQAVADAGGQSAITQVDVDWSEDPQHFLKRGFSAANVERMVFGNSLHGIDVMTHLAGRIADPHVVVRRGATGFDWNMSVHGVGTHGAVAGFRSSWGSPGKWRVQFCAPARRYVFAPLESCVVQEAGVAAERTLAPDPADARFKAGFLLQAQTFLQMVQTRSPAAEASLESLAGSMEVAEALTRSLLAR